MSESQRRLVWLWLTLAEFGETPEFSSLNDRIEIQKFVYLAQEATGARAYHFNPYIRGPYSPSLTRDLYGLLEPGRLEEARDQAALYKLNTETLENLDHAKGIVDDRNVTTKLNRVEWLELVASLYYKYDEAGGDFDEAWRKVKEWKEGIFDECDARAAWDSLTRSDLVVD